MIKQKPPHADQIELTLFGPGYGECATVHLGGNRWIIADSCMNSATGEPAILEYFSNIGVDTQEAVRLITISHWHDDHIRGLSKVISACPNATVCCSTALTTKEFINYTFSFKNILIKSRWTGATEIREIFETLKTLPQTKRQYAMGNCRVLTLPAQNGADSCSVTTLSPSSREYEIFLQGISLLIPPPNKTKIRARNLTPNHTAVALWVEIGDIRILLGSDVEEKGDPSTGWSAIVQSANRPQGRASLYKIPHHGSRTGHHDQVLSDMIADPAIAVLSPFYSGRTKLPTSKDIARILKATPESYITTSDSAPKCRTARPAAVERTIRETVKKIRLIQPPMGRVTIRNEGKTNPNCWNVDLSPSACQLTSLQDQG